MASRVTNKHFSEVYGQSKERNDLNSLYSIYTSEYGTVDALQLQDIYETLRNCKLSIPQIEASIKHVCSGYPDYLECDEEEFLDVLQEMDRRSFLAQDLQWEFAMLDRHGKGTITIDEAMYMFKMVHGEFFSKDRFDVLISKRLTKDCEITFQEIEVELCDIPTFQWIEDQLASEQKLKEIELAKKRQEEKELMAKRQKEEEERLAKQAEMERLQKEEQQRLAKEAADRAEEERRRLEEENRRREEARRKNEEEEKKRKDEEDRLRKEEEEERLKREEDEKLRKEEEDRRRREEEERLKKEEEEKLKQEEEERLRKEEEERLRKEEEDRLKNEEEERLRREEEEKKAEEEKRNQEEAERLAKEKEEEDRLAEEERVRKSKQKARDNWKKLKNLGNRDLLPDDLKSLRKIKQDRILKEAAEDENNADKIAAAEDKAEDQLLKAEEMLKNAASEEERKEALALKNKAEADALLNREKRLRLQLKTAVRLRNRPKLDVSIDEAKESKIEALKPDIGKAEVVSDSLKCGEELEDAMVKRDLGLIEGAVEKIKTKKIENEHMVQILAAEKLIDKLRRLEKAKKDILELNQRTIAEIRSYSQPIPAIREVMTATYMILGYKEKELKEWKFIQALLGRTGKESLKRMCTTLEASKIDLNIAKSAETKYLNNHSLESITDISAGIGTFYAWSTNIIEEARNWAEDSEFRKKIEEKRKMEQEEAQQLQDARKKKGAAKGAASNKGAANKGVIKTPEKSRKAKKNK